MQAKKRRKTCSGLVLESDTLTEDEADSSDVDFEGEDFETLKQKCTRN